MAYSFRHTNPQLTGVLIREKVCCGKQNCRCIREKRLHKWYYYLYWRDYSNNGILKKQYIPKNDVRNLKRKIKIMKIKDMNEKTEFNSYLKLFKQLF